jgi:methylenetetrahydrofolate reductase (NADPH)
VAGYPEKHFEAPNMDTDMQYLKKKVELGADYIITQMFFDNQKFHDFVKRCREMGITVPIIPGMKPIYSKKQLTILPKTFHIDLPTDLANAVHKCKTDLEVEKVGAEWLLMQSRELKKAGVPVLHYYTLGRPQLIADVVGQI